MIGPGHAVFAANHREAKGALTVHHEDVTFEVTVTSTDRAELLKAPGFH